MPPLQILFCVKWLLISLKVSLPVQGVISVELTLSDESEMLEIPNIDPDKVARYGKNFLKLIRDAHRSYEAMMQQHEDRPQDPNHQNVIDISSDDDYGDAGDLDEFDADEESQEELRPSHYFQHSGDSEVDAFNMRSRCSD
jgi:bloom syndrome protein